MTTLSEALLANQEFFWGGVATVSLLVWLWVELKHGRDE